MANKPRRVVRFIGVVFFKTMANIKDILEGWGRLIIKNFSELEPEVQTRAEARLLTCNDCEMRTSSICDPNKLGKHIKTGALVKGCGCHLRSKVLATNSKCPLGKW